MNSEGGLDAARETVLRYLVLMERRDIDAAQRLVAADAVFIFPGGTQRRDLAAIVAGSTLRYRSIGKTIDRCDLCRGPGGVVIAYVMGTLQGLWLDGEAFAGIRFVDRFELSDGLIRRQEVWNDSGEARARRAG